MCNQAGRAKKVFAAGNTGMGFYSFFQYIAFPNIRRAYVLKGGPGTGKSSVMKRIAETVMDKGFGVELHYCASDIDSLDGLVIPGLGAAFIDGTRPHLYDPICPGALDQIVNLGEHWDSFGIQVHKREIMEAGEEGSQLFRSAHRYLKAAKEIRENQSDKVQNMQDWGWVNQRTGEIVTKLVSAKPVASQPGLERHLFVSAITPGGPKGYPESLVGDGTKIILVKGLPGSGKSTLLNKVASAALERGYMVEYYHDPIEPEKIRHILLPGLDICLSTSTELFPYGPVSDHEVVNLDYGLCQGKVEGKQVELRTDGQTFTQLVNTAVHMLMKAREAHQKLESYYVGHMDFDGLDDVYNRLMAEIMADTHTSG